MELSKHCLTRETLLDTIISCASCILRFPLFRDHHPTFKPYGPNLSSRFSEYGFRFSRKNMQMLSSRGFMLAFKHYIAEISMQATAPQTLHIPAAKHGERLVEHSIRRVQFDPPPPGWFPDDAEIEMLIDAGLADVRELYWCVCHMPLDPDAKLFETRWKHLNLAATWDPKARRRKKASAAAAAAQAQDTVQPEGDAIDDAAANEKEDGEAAEVVLADADDMAEAARLIGMLVAQHGTCTSGEDQQLAVSGGKAALARKLAAIFCAFNKSIQEELSLRKFRFRQLKLLRTRELASGGPAAKGEKEVIEEGDNLVVLYLEEQGQHWCWAVGHVEAIIVARTPVPASKCSPADLEAAAKTADFRDQVDIDDPQAMFQLRWFSELDKDGQLLEGYGNAACATYRLPIFEHHHIFGWTSNHQARALCGAQSLQGFRSLTLSLPVSSF